MSRWFAVSNHTSLSLVFLDSSSTKGQCPYSFCSSLLKYLGCFCHGSSGGINIVYQKDVLILNLTYYLKRSCYVATSVFFIKTILRLNSPASNQSSLPRQLCFMTPRGKNSFRNIIAPLLFPLGLRRNRHYRKLWTGPSLSQLLPGKIVCYFCCQFRQQIFSLQVLHRMHGLFHATTISIQKAGSCQVFAQQSLAMKITLLLQLAATTTA